MESEGEYVDSWGLSLVVASKLPESWALCCAASGLEFDKGKAKVKAGSEVKADDRDDVSVT